MNTDKIITEIISNGDPDFAQWSSPILQIKKSGYGEDDKLLGVRTPFLRQLAKKNNNLTINEIVELLHNEYHEIRSFALMVMINQFKNNITPKSKLVDIYIENADYINNWDLVDISAPNIIGAYVYENRDKISILYDLSETSHLWKQRIAIVSTQYLIKHGFYEPTIKLAEKYLFHPHHLIHKATGWMLRELGKADIQELYSFLDKYASKMPRVELRYAIERLDETQRSYYMGIK